MFKNWISVGAVAGAKAIVLGAFGAHAFKNFLEANQKIAIYQTAVEYHFYHALALIGVGILQKIFPEQNRSIHQAGQLFLWGIILFSGSLYVFSVTSYRWIGFITPFGGIMLIAAWLFLGWSFRKLVL